MAIVMVIQHFPHIDDTISPETVLVLMQLIVSLLEVNGLKSTDNSKTLSDRM